MTIEMFTTADGVTYERVEALLGAAEDFTRAVVYADGGRVLADSSDVDDWPLFRDRGWTDDELRRGYRDADARRVEDWIVADWAAVVYEGGEMHRYRVVVAADGLSWEILADADEDCSETILIASDTVPGTEDAADWLAGFDDSLARAGWRRDEDWEPGMYESAAVPANY